MNENTMPTLILVEGQDSLSQENGLRILSTPGSRTIAVSKSLGQVMDSEVELRFDPLTNNEGGMYGVIFRYREEGGWIFIGQDGVSGKDPTLTSWVMMTERGAKQLLLTDGQRIYRGRKAPYTLRVRLIGDAVTIFLDHLAIYQGRLPGITMEPGFTGLCWVNGSGAEIHALTMSAAVPPVPEIFEEAPVEISSPEMTVQMDPSFPRPIRYRLTSTGAEVTGQPLPIYTVELNNVPHRPEVTLEAQPEELLYHLRFPEVQVSFDVRFSVRRNVLRLEILDIVDKDSSIRTIHFPGQALVSLEGSRPGAELRINDYRRETILPLTQMGAEPICRTTALAVLSCAEAAASINNGSSNNRQAIAYQTVEAGGRLYTGLYTNEYQYRGLDDVPMGPLWTEVAVTGDRNGDGKVDFQDGAIARRDDIGTPYPGRELASSAMSMIAMDTGSEAQYPFLRILDNIKKLHAATDGFGQLVIIKGYQGEGHDAAHPDYANISTRAGGEADFRVLLDNAGKYNAKLGLHINHTEIYPESRPYSTSIAAEVPGWSWYDQSYHIIRENDIMDQENGLEKRLTDLSQLTEGKLSMLYVDTYQDSRWQAERLSRKICQLGWALGTEYSEELIDRSVWSHTLNSPKFNYDSPGNLVRFVEHQNKDIFAPSPLFRGFVDRNHDAGIFGWQTCWSFDKTMENFFTRLLPQKYLASFPIYRWHNNVEALLGDKGQVVTRLEGGMDCIYKDGLPLAEGSELCIPWPPQTEEKLYHWSTHSGPKTWALPLSWAGETAVKLFRLSDQGRQDMMQIPVENGKITLDTKAKTGYVLYRGTAEIFETDLDAYDWGQGSPVRDMGFDSHRFGYAWEKYSSSGSTEHIRFENNASANASPEERADNAVGNTHIHVEGGCDAVLTQIMTGLRPGETYAVSVFAEASEGRAVTLRVTTPDGASVSNFVDSYKLLYGVTHNDRFGTHYQRLKLHFTEPEGFDTAELRLEVSASGDDGWAALDNVRAVPVGRRDLRGHDFFEDFEHIDQGYGPFLPVDTADRCHLSEANGSWTKDVISGRYSLKIRGNGAEVELHNEHLRTAPHTLRLKSGTSYVLGLDCLMPEAEANAPVLEGAPLFFLEVNSRKAAQAGSEKAVVLRVPIPARDHEAHSIGPLPFTTGDFDDYCVDLLDESYAHEFVIDNFYVDEV